ncbi:acyl-CoA thioesterase [Sporosarcina sp. NCCP-2222]|uniref:acyl-CoA thioesterase/bile acid-CoA:amino acid N-acyltransferase family protein n=1 Tax=Sporosarcina sp. NCCP-2222 TaxID=2935073 RepID=UPI002089E181|nr:acyl-CoA thioesterase/bile acid-CoA:amino acid N-acyltransferase family protein [Sporosarcina sp. NCCP-2222]GKV56130.1 acyl-CoA thioesterase [Sporosarcina sp. NCCP-2222]
MNEVFNKPRLHIDVKSVLMDQSISIRVKGLIENQKITVRCKRTSYWGTKIYEMESYGIYKANSSGVIDLHKTASIEGTYKGIDGMGLFWSMQIVSTKENNMEILDKLQPHIVFISIEEETQTIDTHIIERRWMDAAVTRTAVNEQGIVGTLFHSSNSIPKPTLLVGGRWIGRRDLRISCSLLASRGFNVLSLGYWGMDPLSSELVNIPLELVGNAIQWLKQKKEIATDFIGMHGTSKGAELALLAAVHFKEIKAVVALNGSPVALCGIVPWTDEAELPPAWTFEGKPISYARRDNSVEIAKTCSALREAGKNPLRTWYDYLTADPEITKQATIPVENINGPILLISGMEDACFDSVGLNEIAMKRLGTNKFKHEYEHLTYERAGHEIGIPNISISASEFTGGTKFDTAQASQDSWEKTIDFFKRASHTEC